MSETNGTPLRVEGAHHRGRFLYAPHAPDPDRLTEVRAEMAEAGPPTIPVYFNGQDFEAVDGSHRIAAAAALGVPVRLVELSLEEPVGPSFDNAGRLVAHVLHFLRAGPRQGYRIQHVEEVGE